jgi:predicted membrane-bound spermidine synthase
MAQAPSINIKIKTVHIYALSFLEGGSVMAVELSGAKMMAPFFGTSLYVWSAVMATTLGGLAAGYFLGGRLSAKEKPVLWMLRVLFLAGLTTLWMPFLAHATMSKIFELPFLWSIILSCVIFILPPVLLMGAFSPLVIASLNQEGKDAGKTSGTVFAVSTCGGIIATFLFGFYIIPLLGLRWPMLFLGGLLALTAAWFLRKERKTLALLPVVLIGILTMQQLNPVKSDYFRVVDLKEGLLGQVAIVDYPEFDAQGKEKGFGRAMIFNRIAQAWMKVEKDSIVYFPYVHAIKNGVEDGKGKRALVLGLGGGCVANEMINKGYQVDAVEFDERVIEMAQKYFQLDKRIGLVTDDARHFVNRCKTKYDLIIVDIFKAEENPAHIITMESLQGFHSILKDDGTIVLNGYGFWKGERGLGVRSIVKTLINAGFSVAKQATAEKEEEGNLLLLIKRSCDELVWNQKHQGINPFELEEAFVLTDEQPRLEHLNLLAVKEWRSSYLQKSIGVQLEHHLPIF